MLKRIAISRNFYVIPGLKHYGNEGKKITFEMIEKEVCDYLNVDLKLIAQKNREREVVEARHIIFYLAKKYLVLSLTKIAKRYNRDHTTVIHALMKIEGLLQTDIDFVADFEHIQNKLSS